MFQNQRNSQRLPMTLPIHLSFGSQITLQGQVKDLSLKSAFINMKSSAIHMALNDELTFNIGDPDNADDPKIRGSARISRVSAGEGIAIYFTEMDKKSTNQLQKLVGETV